MPTYLERQRKDKSMATKLFVGSLPYSVDDAELESLFSEFGTVASAKIILDRDHNNRSKGFGFVEFESDDDAKAAIAALDGKDLGGRKIVVNEAKPQEKREFRPRSNDGGGYGGGGGQRQNRY